MMQCVPPCPTPPPLLHLKQFGRCSHQPCRCYRLYMKTTFCTVFKGGDKSCVGISSQSHPGEEEEQNVRGCSCRRVLVPDLSAQPRALPGPARAAPLKLAGLRQPRAATAYLFVHKCMRCKHTQLLVHAEMLSISNNRIMMDITSSCKIGPAWKNIFQHSCLIDSCGGAEQKR